METKYRQMDNAARPVPKPEPVRDIGVLMIHDALEDAGQLRQFATRLHQEGCAVMCVDLNGYVPVDRFDRKPVWQRWLEQAQAGYQALSHRCVKTVVLGSGHSCGIACVIAEQYPVDGLILVGGGLKKKAFTLAAGPAHRASYQLARLARNNLFSIVCPILSLVPEFCGAYAASSANMYKLGTRSEDVTIKRLEGADVSKLWTDCENSVAAPVRTFLTRLEV